MSHGSDATAAHGGHGHGQVGHIVPTWLLGAVLGALLVLTGVTYAIAAIKLGNWNIIVAIAIATVKATLVALFFMHLRWDKPFNAIVIVSSLVFVALFVSFAMMDTHEYNPTLAPGEAPGMAKQP